MGSKTFDLDLLLKDAGAVTADAAGSVGGSAKVLDMGTGFVGELVQAIVDTTALDTSSADETYTVRIQGSVDEAFTTPVELAAKAIKSTGREEIPFTNIADEVAYRYVRAFIDVGGTTPSINCSIWVGKQ